MDLSRIDITVGLELPRVGEVRLNHLLRKIDQVQVGVKMPKIGEQPLGQRMGADPPKETEFPNVPTPGVSRSGVGQRLDVMA